MWRRAIKTLALAPAPRHRRSLVPPSAPRCFSSTAESEGLKQFTHLTYGPDDPNSKDIKTGHEVKDIRNIYYYEDKEVVFYRQNEPPVIVDSYYDRRIIACSCGHPDETFGFYYFLLCKGKPEACRVCGQQFELNVVGTGRPPP